jgi:hypothetical protein
MRHYLTLILLLSLFGGPVLANGASAQDEKYQFDNLDTVKRFHNWSIDGWNAIDQRSLIVRTSPSTSYLVILDRRVPDLRLAETIAISSTGSFVHAKFDTVLALNRYGMTIPANIAKIYRLEGKEQRRWVREQILNS